LPRKETGTFVFETIRRIILTRFSELVHKCFPAEPAGEEAFTYALYLCLRSLHIADVAMDGWRMLRIAGETATSLRAVGIMHVLPTGELPIEVELSGELHSIRYWVRIGMDDDRWGSLTDSKRWKAVYLYANGARDEAWHWSQPISGCFPE
jgi:hypothetical protein